MPESKQFTRRSFFKGASAGAALAGLSCAGFGCTSPLSPTESSGEAAAPEEKECLQACRGACTAHCAYYAVVRDGKFVKVKPAHLSTIGLDNGSLCVKGASQPYVTYGEERLQYPYKRVGERGADEWEQITWDEAIETTATKFLEIQEKYGKERSFVHQSLGR